MILKNYLLPILVLVLIGGCSSFDFQKDGVHLASLPKKVEKNLVPRKIWSKRIGQGNNYFYSNLHPTFKGNTVYAADRFGIVKALNLSNGKDRWIIDLSENNEEYNGNTALLSGGITVYGNNLYIGSEHGKLYSLRTKDGSLVWTTQVIGEILSSPVVKDNLIFVHTSNGFLQGINRNNGKVQWSFELGTYPISTRDVSTPTFMFDSLIIGDGKGRVNAISIKNNQMIWKQNISSINSFLLSENLKDVNVTPIIFEGVVYIASYNGSLTALNFNSGTILWQKNIGIVKKLIVSKHKLYIVDGDDNLLSLNTDKGNIIWKQNHLINHQLTTPVIYNNYLVVGDIKGYLHWIDTNNGKYIIQQKLSNSGFQSKPIISHNTIIIQSKNGYVYAVTV
ncbi:outer membrane protein assembly factor BamB [Candidatus Pantoea edessiphila]|uniref:Outer membrane protein assembly factor BamB n=1 Tax=Candidatus Pantoea edessiphila TaxID=2044610 RepID=A0A2P5SWI0_9GAMM|nr:outer membrane protein assembly factor BamB [Candidatus Pantoea edessiphila]PPI86682.1 outer membrane protein assembly factor BamB [Candidatus Pantoea edessiphila]